MKNYEYLTTIQENRHLSNNLLYYKTQYHSTLQKKILLRKEVKSLARVIPCKENVCILLKWQQISKNEVM